MSHTPLSIVEFFNAHDRQRQENRNHVGEAWGCEKVRTAIIPQSAFGQYENPERLVHSLLSKAKSETAQERIIWDDIYADDNNIVVATIAFGPYLMDKFMQLLADKIDTQGVTTHDYIIDRTTLDKNVKGRGQAPLKLSA